MEPKLRVSSSASYDGLNSGMWIKNPKAISYGVLGSIGFFVPRKQIY
jgi:hypothetical protein